MIVLYESMGVYLNVKRLLTAPASYDSPSTVITASADIIFLNTMHVHPTYVIELCNAIKENGHLMHNSYTQFMPVIG